MKNSLLLMFLMMLLLSNCQKHKVIVNLPTAITNNAVALVNNSGDIELYSFNGLKSAKTWQDISGNGFKLANGIWGQIEMPKDAQAVLASTAVSIGKSIYLIGGYTVNDKKEEKSVADIFKYNSQQNTWINVTKMPVPVDDTVALVYQSRYIYLISGWHDTDNVSLVQVYDTLENKWFNATDYKAPGVFGHSGGIVNNHMLICDGVKVVVLEKSRDFVSSAVCLKGEINPLNPSQIEWQEVAHHSNTAYYRMASVGNTKQNTIVFAGGSDNPYNYDGIGYNGKPSKASTAVMVFNMENNSWKMYPDLIEANMDHRALLTDGKWYYIVGGMQKNQIVSSKIIKFKL